MHDLVALLRRPLPVGGGGDRRRSGLRPLQSCPHRRRRSQPCRRALREALPHRTAARPSRRIGCAASRVQILTAPTRLHRTAHARLRARLLAIQKAGPPKS